MDNGKIPWDCMEHQGLFHIQSLVGTRLPTMVRKDNYMYYFGGIGSKEVFRIHLDLTSDWEKLDDMEDKGKSLIVIPYN